MFWNVTVLRTFDFYMLFWVYNNGPLLTCSCNDLLMLATKFLDFCLEAVADANKAIELNPSLSKAYLRKG